ncbi:MAG: 4-(cytidine 5'-diphospho)-2-C-methyl-D-erythritol kinase [Bacteroidales bacterium]|nr:4-(cytidine 5'-diphospho)-2-C-methyl-D-erythritol kinase [Bacteroidales bacterium]MDY4630354.1 4-(cytidine 5'-diphospho)-2-C-methyl-D-erythritol kinase [Candidatus Cryptobacteroides sp.]
MVCHPPVKINLGLNVLRKRPDGFHDLETLFIQSGQFRDSLEVIKADDWSRSLAELGGLYPPECIAQDISPDGKLMITVARREGVDWPVLKDLCAKAYFLLDADFGLPPVKIYLEKKSPVGAGLGGGSADAAYCLKMLNELCGLGLEREQLLPYAARLGSDCALFLYDCPVFGEGRGEVLRPFSLPIGIGGEYRLEIVVPEGISVSTAEAYRGIVPAIPEIRLEEALKRPVEEWKELIVNDFEKSVFKEHPQLAAIKQSLYDSGAVYAAMSGSGSALFAIYRS